MEVANACNRTLMRLLLNCFNLRYDVVPLALIELYRQLVARRERGHTSNLRQIYARKGLSPDITSWCADEQTVLGFPGVKLEETSQLPCINLILDCYCILFVYQCFRTKTLVDLSIWFTSILKRFFIIIIFNADDSKYLTVWFATYLLKNIGLRCCQFAVNLIK